MDYRSLTTFLFTSNKELVDKFGLWYPMWINPNSVDLTFKPNQNGIMTKRGYVYFHWQHDLPVLNFTGYSGWILAEAERGLANILFTKKIFAEAEGIGFQTKGIFDILEVTEGIAQGLELPNTVKYNQPRLFVERLQKVALQPMFYFDKASGVKKYNTKYLFIFTKRYPQGRKLEGFFTNFRIDESADDSQMIKYSCTFTVQKGLKYGEMETDEFVSFFKGLSRLTEAVSTEPTNLISF